MNHSAIRLAASLTLACLLGLLLPHAGSSEAINAGGLVLDDLKRDYQVRTLDNQPADAHDRRMYNTISFTYWTEPVMQDGKQLIRFHREEKTKEGYLVNYIILFDPVDSRLIQAERKITNAAGQVLSSHFDNYTLAPEIFGKGVLHFNMYPVVFQQADLSPGAKISLNLAMSAENQPMTINLEVDGEEPVTVPAGAFQCIRLKMTFDTNKMLGSQSSLAKIVGYLFPSYIVWIDKTPPHLLIKMQGKFGGLSSAEQAYELAKVYRDK